MYVIEKIDKNNVKIEKDGIFIFINKIFFNWDIKEGDVFEVIKNEYLFNHEKTQERKTNISKKFDKLKK